MSNDVFDVLDELAARGRRLRGQLPGDYKPIEGGDLAGDVLTRLHGLVLSGWTTVGEKLQWEEEAQ